MTFKYYLYICIEYYFKFLKSSLLTKYFCYKFHLVTVIITKLVLVFYIYITKEILLRIFNLVSPTNSPTQ